MVIGIKEGPTKWEDPLLHREALSHIPYEVRDATPARDEAGF